MEKIITTVSMIFKERYGAQLKIERRMKTNKVSKTYFNSNWDCPFVYSRTLRQVSFPIFNSKKELQAIATASPVENKDAIIFDEMAQFLQLTVAEHIELSEKQSIQERAEEAFERSHHSSNKVIPLHTKKKPGVPHIVYKKNVPKRQPDLKPIWIKGDNMDFSAHIAFSIHDWVSNWAFINATEIPDLIWEDPNQWESFSQVTIFIPNITKLSKEKIERLKENLRRVRNMEQKPLVVVTSPSEIPDDLTELIQEFKPYKANERVTARVQAHFLLYHHKERGSWTHHCNQTDSLYFLPFSPGPQNLH